MLKVLRFSALYVLSLMLPTLAYGFAPACDGVTDDTATIQAALNNAATPNAHPQTVTLPEGTCVITKSLVIGTYGSLVGAGNGTKILADYAHWNSSANGNYDAIEITSSDTMPDQRFAGNRRISGFLLEGRGNSGIVSKGIHVFYTGPNAGLSVSGQFSLISFDHLLIYDFDTAMDLSDIAASSVSDVSISTVRQGIFVEGEAINLNMNHIQMQYSSYAGPYTALSSQASNGLTITGKSYPSHGTQYPQGILLSDSSVIQFDSDLVIQYCLSCNFHDNVLDYGGMGLVNAGSTVVLGLPHDINIRGNFIATNCSYCIGIEIQPANTDNNNIWIEGNYVVGYPSGNTVAGVSFDAGGSLSRGYHINHNSFHNVWQGINIAHAVGYSTIIGNYGEQVTAYLINLNGSFNQSLPSLYVDGNTDADSVSVVNAGSAANYKLGWNSSPIQTTTPN